MNRSNTIFLLIHQLLIEKLSPVHRSYNLFLRLLYHQLLNIIATYFACILVLSQLSLKQILLMIRMTELKRIPTQPIIHIFNEKFTDLHHLPHHPELLPLTLINTIFLSIFQIDKIKLVIAIKTMLKNNLQLL